MPSVMRFSFEEVVGGHPGKEPLLKIPFKIAELQMQDIKTACACGRFLFALEVGCGKTVCSTVTAKMWDAPHNIVICPPIILDQWQEWLNEIGIPDVSIFRGPRRTVDLLHHNWVLMSHAIFRDSFDTIHHVFDKKEITLIVDEAQALKSPKSKLFRLVNQFVTPDRNILMLTGTPTSKPEDTYAYMKLKQSTYRSWGHWQNLHVKERDVFGNIKAYQNLELLADNFAVASVKRTKQEIFGDTLEPIYQRIPYELDKKHLKLYERLAEEQLLLLDNGDKIDATTATRMYHALQQIVVNYSRFSGNPEDRSKAYDVIDEVIEEVDPLDLRKSKLVVWTYYVSSSETITAYLKDKCGDKAVVAAYGKVNSQKSVDLIMNDVNTRILVAQPSSVGVGLNLQHVCSENLFIEMSTTPMQIRQACGRTDRIGQKVRPTMRFAQAKSTIQLALFAKLLKNDELISAVERSKTSLRKEIFGQT